MSIISYFVRPEIYWSLSWIVAMLLSLFIFSLPPCFSLPHWISHFYFYYFIIHCSFNILHLLHSMRFTVLYYTSFVTNIKNVCVVISLLCIDTFFSQARLKFFCPSRYINKFFSQRAFSQAYINGYLMFLDISKYIYHLAFLRLCIPSPIRICKTFFLGEEFKNFFISLTRFCSWVS